MSAAWDGRRIHEDLLRYRSARYFWVAVALIVASLVLYWTQRPDDPPNGGTWQGYVLGTVGALLIVWLALLGVRKRRYRSRLGSVNAWTSAHVYFGSALFVVGTLHTAWQFAWNVHTLAYVLMLIVISSGLFGVYAYLLYPRQRRGLRGGHSREELFAELYELNERAGGLSFECSPIVRAAVQSSIARTAIGGGLVAQLRSMDRSTFTHEAEPGSAQGSTNRPVPNRDQQAVIDFLANRIPRAEKRAEAERLQALLSLLYRRQAVLRRIRADIQFQAWLQVWLFVHVPFTVALLGALAVHILSTFLYW